MKHRPDVKAVVHCHPPHATAFAVAREPIPQCVLPEIEVFMGEVPLAPYETPGGNAFANTVVPFLEKTNTIILTNHGTVSFGSTLEEAYWKTEILDAYCRILILTKQLGGQVNYLNEQKSRELLDLKKKLGFDDPRFHNENCDLCGNSAFREGYKEGMPTTKAFDAPPSYAGYLKPAGSKEQGGALDPEAVVKLITDQVMAAMRG
jgi:L-fuculose-phosphate aldolase